MSGGSNLRSSSSYRRLNPLCLKLSIIAPRFCCHQCKSSIYVSRFSLHLGVASELLTCGKKARPKQRKVRVHVESLEASGRRFVDAWRTDAFPSAVILNEINPSEVERSADAVTPTQYVDCNATAWSFRSPVAVKAEGDGYLRLRGFRKRTPSSSPFSPMNSTPAASSARCSFARVSSETRGPLPASTRLTVGRDNPARAASADWDQPRRPRAARSCSIVIEIS